MSDKWTFVADNDVDSAYSTNASSSKIDKGSPDKFKQEGCGEVVCYLKIASGLAKSHSCESTNTRFVV